MVVLSQSQRFQDTRSSLISLLLAILLSRSFAPRRFIMPITTRNKVLHAQLAADETPQNDIPQDDLSQTEAIIIAEASPVAVVGETQDHGALDVAVNTDTNKDATCDDG